MYNTTRQIIKNPKIIHSINNFLKNRIVFRGTKYKIESSDHHYLINEKRHEEWNNQYYQMKEKYPKRMSELALFNFSDVNDIDNILHGKIDISKHLTKGCANYKENPNLTREKWNDHTIICEIFNQNPTTDLLKHDIIFKSESKYIYPKFYVKTKIIKDPSDYTLFDKIMLNFDYNMKFEHPFINDADSEFLKNIF